MTESLVERASLPCGIADSGGYRGAMADGDSRGVVGAVVAHYDDMRGKMSLLAQRAERGADRRRLVVGRNEHRDGAGRSARGGWRLAGRLIDKRGSQVDKCL